MNTAIAWSGFLGAWLLVAGPLSQATRELEEEDFERDSLAEAARNVPKPESVSGWWWMFPPAHYFLQRRRSQDYRRAVWEALPDEHAVAFASFRDKADAWFYVAAGAFLIGIKETWELHEAYEWPQWTFWAFLVAMSILCVASTGARMRRRRSWRSRSPSDDG
jgi:hypothetical protein